MSQPIIEVQALTKRYKSAEVNAVDGISFSVAPGDLFALLGPNGAGKTTTISILTTTLAPTTGHVSIAGNDIVRDARAVRRQIGIIFQHPSLDLNLTAEENIRFHAVLYGLYPFRPLFTLMPRHYRQRVRELAEILGIGDAMSRPVRTFSGGMRRKLEIVRSLMQRPKVLFLDEPTIGLDPASRRDLWAYLTKLRGDDGTTIFLTTHYLDEAEEADAICIIDHGKIVSYGTPAEVKADLVQEYLLLDAQQREQLQAELRALGLPFDPSPPFKVMLNGHSAQQVIKALDTPLSLLQTHTPTLEDAYLAIVGRS